LLQFLGMGVALRRDTAFEHRHHGCGQLVWRCMASHAQSQQHGVEQLALSVDKHIALALFL
jgi:hypothetical protein